MVGGSSLLLLQPQVSVSPTAGNIRHTTAMGCPVQDDVVAFEVNLAVKGDVTIAMWFTDHFAEVCALGNRMGLPGSERQSAMLGPQRRLQQLAGQA